MGFFCAFFIRMLSLNPLPFCPHPQFHLVCFQEEDISVTTGSRFHIKKTKFRNLISCSRPPSTSPPPPHVVTLPFTEEF